MKYDEAKQKLESLGQTHLLMEWENLSLQEKESLLAQIKNIVPATFQLQRNLLKERMQEQHRNFTPFTKISNSGNDEYLNLGTKLLKSGKVGALIVAGGEGSRLGYTGPKGCFPISNIENKSLYQLFAEKTVAASNMAGVALPLAVMTSTGNHDETLSFFQKNNYFGLDRNQIDFFSQGSLPYLDQKGDMFLKNPSTIATGANGNGTVFYHFFDSGFWEKWHHKGIEYVNFAVIDNILGDPFDAELVGYHHRYSCDTTVKCIERDDPKEKVGTLISSGGRVKVVEYSEMPEEEVNARDPVGHLKHRCANISLFCFDMDLIHRAAVDDDTLMPYHLAFKAVEYLSNKGTTIKSERPIAWKFEKFVFDILPLAGHVGCLLYPREECFAPLKSADDIKNVKRALIEEDKRLWNQIAATEPPAGVFELSQQFHYPTENLYRTWKGKPFPNISYLNSGP